MTWWARSRLGIRFDLSLSVVPGWAPVGADASRYGEMLADVPEVIAHHRDRWGHVADFDDFAGLLRFESFDPGEWAQAASDAGAGYCIVVGCAADAWRWWPAPGVVRRLTELGPRRDVVGELADACRRRDVAVGTESHTAPSEALELARHAGSVLVAAGATRAADVTTLLDRATTLDPSAVVAVEETDVPEPANADSLVTTIRDRPPRMVRDAPWQLLVPIGRGGGPNAARRQEHHLNAFEIVDLLTEVVAKGGHLLIDVAPGNDGTISAEQTEPLREAGRWIRRHGGLLARSKPWTAWGDSDVRYLDVGGDLVLVDVTGRGRFPALNPSAVRVGDVVSIDAPGRTPTWMQDVDGLQVDSEPSHARRSDDHVGIAIYRVHVEAPPATAMLFPSADTPPIELAPLLEPARPGEIVHLGDGAYVGPVVVPDGVTVRGLGPDRTRILAQSDTDDPVIVLGARSRLEHVASAHDATLARLPDADRIVVEVVGDDASVLGCRLDGVVRIGAAGVAVRASELGAVDAADADGLSLVRCEVDGRPRGTSVAIHSSERPVVDSCVVGSGNTAIQLADVVGATIRGCTLESGWTGIHLHRTHQTHAHANRIERTVRAFDIDGGTDVVVDGNWVVDGDSGCVVRGGASGAIVAGNRWEACRIGLLVWDVTTVEARDNVGLDLAEPPVSAATGGTDAPDES